MEEGKAIEFLTCSEASAKTLMLKLSNEPMIEQEHFRFSVLILGFFLLIT
jgi:hypothetical protein